MKQRPWYSAFFSRVRARLKVGEREYGDKSHNRPLADLIDEIQQEIEDQTGWGAIAWNKLEKLKKLIEAESTKGREM